MAELKKRVILYPGAAVLVVAALVLPWWFAPASAASWQFTNIMSSLWPVLLGAALIIAVLFWISHHRRQAGTISQHEHGYPAFVPRIPPGDLLIPLSHMVMFLYRFARRCSVEQLPPWRDAGLDMLKRSWSSMMEWRTLEQIETGLARWHNGLLLFVMLGLLLAWWSWNA